MDLKPVICPYCGREMELDDRSFEGYGFWYTCDCGASTPFCKSEEEANQCASKAAQPKWISVEERLPKAETQVLILAKRGKYFVVTNGMYEDGTVNTEDSDWYWYDNNFEYDEETDAFIIPVGWWEYKHYNGDDEYNHAIDDVVTHWMPLPPCPEEVK